MRLGEPLQEIREGIVIANAEIKGEPLPLSQGIRLLQKPSGIALPPIGRLHEKVAHMQAIIFLNDPIKGHADPLDPHQPTSLPAIQPVVEVGIEVEAAGLQLLISK